MPEPIEPDPRATAVKRAVPDNPRFHQDTRIALRAQAQYRATLKILLVLKDEHHADEKPRISTNKLLESGIQLHHQWVTQAGPGLTIVVALDPGTRAGRRAAARAWYRPLTELVLA